MVSGIWLQGKGGEKKKDKDKKKASSGVVSTYNHVSLCYPVTFNISIISLLVPIPN